MTKKIKKFFIILLLVVVTIFAFFFIKVKTSLYKYNKAVENFINIDTNIVNSKINKGDKFFLYVGRASCPWCYDLVLPLSEISRSNNIN